MHAKFAQKLLKVTKLRKKSWDPKREVYQISLRGVINKVFKDDPMRSLATLLLVYSPDDTLNWAEAYDGHGYPPDPSKDKTAEILQALVDHFQDHEGEVRHVYCSCGSIFPKSAKAELPNSFVGESK